MAENLWITAVRTRSLTFVSAHGFNSERKSMHACSSPHSRHIADPKRPALLQAPTKGHDISTAPLAALMDRRHEQT